MRLSRVRFTVRQMMGVVALAGFALGFSIEIPRVWRRWLFCRERAEIFSECAANSQEHWQRSLAQLEQTERVIRKLKELGPERRSIASLAGLSGDPNAGRVWFKRFVQYVKQTEGSQESAYDWDNHSISPVACAEWFAVYQQAQRDDVQRRSDGTAAYTRMALAYRKAATRPWERAPHEFIKP